ncbi:hypothetical protein ACFVH6_22225 [Spirillospora sp. NPDC127200]
MTPATELRAAAALLRKPLPVFLDVPPRLVMTDNETVSGIAFCEEHLLEGDEYRYSACDNCDVIDAIHDGLAELIAALLNTRNAQAAWLDMEARRAAEIYHVGDGDIHGCGERLPEDGECDCFADALAIARAINPPTTSEEGQR